MTLHGDTWSALFRSPRLRRGTTELVGHFEADWPGLVPENSMIAGTVTECRLITRTSRPGDDGRHDQGYSDELAPVRPGQTGFTNGLVPEEPPPPDFRSGWVAVGPPRTGPWIRQIGVLVEVETSPAAVRVEYDA
ncbi:hypothetical protein DW322_05350 [Rhodococcus rhodnii]|uniref:Uncharacterized protein n=2 Tax=Rhodococcus rhodnii TaxID=38312 RepID=R7WNL3_9NOCA|nr:hypothetical protein Rrhod_1810 [Rhodococcus rhodnii LMG 5362]TXG89742.1 hypothetical protein DW322_05350 [Rhodococcus rhodnii]